MTVIFGLQFFRWEVTQICYVYKLIVQLKRRGEGCSGENKNSSFIAPERSRQRTLFFKLNKLPLHQRGNAVRQKWSVDFVQERKYRNKPGSNKKKVILHFLSFCCEALSENTPFRQNIYIYSDF